MATLFSRVLIAGLLVSIGVYALLLPVISALSLPEYVRVAIALGWATLLTTGMLVYNRWNMRSCELSFVQLSASFAPGAKNQLSDAIVHYSLAFHHCIVTTCTCLIAGVVPLSIGSYDLVKCVISPDPYSTITGSLALGSIEVVTGLTLFGVARSVLRTMRLRENLLEALTVGAKSIATAQIANIASTGLANTFRRPTDHVRDNQLTN